MCSVLIDHRHQATLAESSPRRLLQLGVQQLNNKILLQFFELANVLPGLLVQKRRVANHLVAS